jgi:steroid 5-alpha reductase family enzyme
VNGKKLASAAAVASVSLLVASGVAWAGGRGGASLYGMSMMAWCAALAFLVQWLAFVPAYAKQTERFYDLVGSLTYIAVVLFALLASGPMNNRSALLALLVFVWAARLGSFLFRRIQAAGSDSRFDSIKPSAARFFVAWTLQGLWVFLTLSAALAAITKLEAAPIGWADLVGLLIWALGFSIEVVADRQKSAHRKARPGKFVDSGLWAWSRHPNYFGEIVLWIGIAVIASSTLRGWQWVTMISPVFVAFLLMRVSGIPMLEKRADERWGDHKAYQKYKAETPVLFPRPPRTQHERPS